MDVDPQTSSNQRAHCAPAAVAWAFMFIADATFLVVVLWMTIGFLISDRVHWSLFILIGCVLFIAQLVVFSKSRLIRGGAKSPSFAVFASLNSAILFVAPLASVIFANGYAVRSTCEGYSGDATALHAACTFFSWHGARDAAKHPWFSLRRAVVRNGIGRVTAVSRENTVLGYYSCGSNCTSKIVGIQQCFGAIPDLTKDVKISPLEEPVSWGTEIGREFSVPASQKSLPVNALDQVCNIPLVVEAPPLKATTFCVFMVDVVLPAVAPVRSGVSVFSNKEVTLSSRVQITNWDKEAFDRVERYVRMSRHIYANRWVTFLAMSCTFPILIARVAFLVTRSSRTTRGAA